MGDQCEHELYDVLQDVIAETLCLASNGKCGRSCNYKANLVIEAIKPLLDPYLTRQGDWPAV